MYKLTKNDQTVARTRSLRLARRIKREYYQAKRTWLQISKELRPLIGLAVLCYTALC